MVSRPARQVLTYEDYLALPDDGKRYQLFEGEIDVTPAPGTVHQSVLKNLVILVDRHVRDLHLGSVFFAPCDVILSDTTVVQPDLLYVARESKAIVLPQHVRGPPDLIVEVLSPTTARIDRHLKRQLYSRFGVANYWRIDPDRREAICDRLEGDQYVQISVVRAGENLMAPAFSEFSIPLSRLWE